MSGVLRLFIAVYPPPAIAAACRDLVACLATDHALPPHRLTPVEQVHLTVQFIGDTPVRELDRVRESLVRSASGLAGWTLTPGCLRVLPTPDRPRLLAVETDCPAALAELKRRLVTRFARRTRRGRDHAFVPHLTVLRFRGAPPPIEPWHDPLAIDAFPCSAVCLMRSTLLPGGARHEEVERVALTG
ncbi:MAG: RNA 2',3'-cyclic phosphodiesterase [Phycisphaerales bacterium]|nr:RNA 2',3'-cyclic phosphodiesterase [Phycisphaerae bacterium]NNF42065.1 RNA 2',3'-cyclic phosphodiesterase [Phycisphaerales bacterium]NNM25783.1 RNA 2',3'-cyclic phosphodiesterase [Phycisphaerales bacterium]